MRLKAVPRLIKRKLFRRRSSKIGLEPGQVVHVGDQHMDRPEVWVIDYGADYLTEHTFEEMHTVDWNQFTHPKTVSWINVTGLHETDVLKTIGESFRIHPLVMEDVADTCQRAKWEENDDHLFVLLKMLYSPSDHSFEVEQFSMVLCGHTVLTFQEKPNGLFDVVQERLRKNNWRLHNRGADFLAYTLLDVIVDHYFQVLDNVADSVETLEDEVELRPSSGTLVNIQRLRREVVMLKKYIWPLREVLSQLKHSESPLLTEETKVYLNDVYDHLIQIIELLESYRDITTGLSDLYMSQLSHQMNKVMQQLTVIATIFMPLTFIVGVYGMNFKYMPELDWVWGYAGVWGVMILLTACLWVYFKQKKLI